MKEHRLLIVYSSRHGHTARIAQRMADAVATIEGLRTEVVPVGKVTESAIALANFFIIAGPVHFERHDRKLQRFVDEHRGVLASRASAFVSISGALATPVGEREANRFAEKFLEATAWIPDRIGLFAGAVPFTKYGWILRYVMRRIARSKGLDTDTTRDYDYTDWDAVDRFARDFVAEQLALSAA